MQVCTDVLEYRKEDYMSSDMLEGLLGSDSRHTVQFFACELQDMLRRTKFNQGEMFYVASVLAHYASVPWQNGRPATSSMSESTVPFAFTRTELSPYLHTKLFGVEPRDAGDCENKGSHIFLMIGFFRRQMEQENNVALYERIAQGYYHRAHQYASDEKRKYFFRQFSHTLPFWSNACSGLSRNLHTKRFVLRLDD